MQHNEGVETMIKAFFLDFYGTVAHEDGKIIKKITEIVCDTCIVENKSEIGFILVERFSNNVY